VGEANFGSRGASVSLQIEVESGLIREPGQLQAKIDYLHELAMKSVDAQLERSNQTTPAMNTAPTNNGNGIPSDNGHTNDNGRHGTVCNNGSHRASDKQMNFIKQLARGIRGLGVRRLETLSNKMFGKPLADLSSLNASSLIDTLKAIKDGQISLNDALSEPAAA
jgi:hypothetical protein